MPKDKQKFIPDDLKFVNVSKEKTSRSLRLKSNESLEDGLKRLEEMGWNVREQKYVRNGRVLTAVAQRVKGATRNLNKGDRFEIEYYDITESQDVPDHIETFKEELSFVGQIGNAIIGKTEKDTHKTFPIVVVVHVQRLTKDAETPENPPDDNTVEQQEQSSEKEEFPS